MLHYTHVGKNASELFVTRDFVCPPEQFVPQRRFSASTRLHFFDHSYYTQLQKDRLQLSWKKFYQARGGKDFWGYDLDDPKIAFGFMKIGSLSEITVSGQQYNIPKTINELNDFRQKLVETVVIDWKIE